MQARLRLRLFFRAHSANLPQEAGGVPVRSVVNIGSMESRKVRIGPASLATAPFLILRRLLSLLLGPLLWNVAGVNLQAAVVARPHTTLVVYGGQRMPEEEWAALSSALEKSFASLALETDLGPRALELVRGENLRPGVQFESVVVVILHGDCRLLGQPAEPETGAPLGWVLRDREEIKPFIHVDCARIAQMLGQRALGMKRDTRNGAMAEAISRVVVHEWIHIATQTPAHTRDGIEKRAFGAADLIPDYVIPRSAGK